MFTGIVEEVGKIHQIWHGTHSAVLEVSANIVTDGLKIGDSVAINGVCLTATKISDHSFCADVMPETLNRSNLGTLITQSPVNLERATQVGDRLGGHIVSGHIDTTATISNILRDDNAIWYTLIPPTEWLRYIIEKGSVTLDGVSLTVARVDNTAFAVSLIPHTAANTTFAVRRIGDKINLECDIIGKYVEKLLYHKPTNNSITNDSAITMDFLTKCGF